MMKDSIAWWLNLPFAAAHELCHYAAARALGLPARFSLTEVRIDVETVDWRAALITLAPSAAGWGALAGAAVIETQRGLQIFWLTLLLNVFWQARCWRDFYCAWCVIRERRWPADDEGPQALSIFGHEIAHLPIERIDDGQAQDPRR